ncbi:hypothetical protein [Aminobacterium mobile]|uniref:hypothetical protein n=1 Tax=Aminobacterium mobile TaxID=81467 RepID=UPI002FD969A5
MDGSIKKARAALEWVAPSKMIEIEAPSSGAFFCNHDSVQIMSRIVTPGKNTLPVIHSLLTGRISAGEEVGIILPLGCASSSATPAQTEEEPGEPERDEKGRFKKKGR